MWIDALVAEIGSTTTVVNAFDGLGHVPCFLGQAQCETTVAQGDVCIGLDRAVQRLTELLCPDGGAIQYRHMYASSSAAGGLKICVYGLVHDMTVRAAEAAALGAGAVIRQTVGGKLSDDDLLEQSNIRPNLILLAGGTDGGERETALFNARRLAQACCKTPVIYAGNAANQGAVSRIFAQSGTPLYITENVYPELDSLNIEPCRRIIHQAFEKHIVSAPGMERIRQRVTDRILPTPGAVMEALRLVYDALGDVIAVDVGGATTDLHSVAAGSPEISSMQTRPEPFGKRTVEGDLGVYVNARHLAECIGIEKLQRELNVDVSSILSEYQPIPVTPEQLHLTQRLTLEAGIAAVKRHAGRLKHLYTPAGRRTVAEGKDLSQVGSIIGTGGALTRLEGRKMLLRAIADCNTDGMMLYPKPGAMQLLFDDSYIMASAGVLSSTYPDAARRLLMCSLKGEA